MAAKHPELVDVLNEVLTAELTAINQYFLHAKLCAHWGFLRLAKRVRHESIDEMKHAERVIDRILFLGGIPNLQRLGALEIGETVSEQLERDHALEVLAVERLNRGIALALTLGDNGTRELLAHILVDEEEHMDWIETQQEAIARIGIERWLAEQLHD